MRVPHDVHLRSLDKDVVAQAADWFVMLQDGADAAMQAACTDWRLARPEHELAWQRLVGLHDTLMQGADRVDRVAAVQAVERGAAHSRARRRNMKALLGMAGLGLVAGTAYRQAPWQQWQAQYRTGTGERREFVLADGSRVLLNTATSADIVSLQGLRTLQLHQGEVMVTSGSEPLQVATASGVAQPVGTQYVVRHLPQMQGMTGVVVLQGRVRLSPADAPDSSLVLEAGQQSLFSRVSLQPPRPADAAAAAWVDGTLAAQSMRLEDFLLELARYRTGLLRCAPAVANLRISGAFPLQDTDRVLQSLSHVLPVRVVWRTRFWVSVEPA